LVKLKVSWCTDGLGYKTHISGCKTGIREAV